MKYSTSLANKYAINTDGTDIDKLIRELEKKLGDYVYAVDDNGNIIRSDRKANIDIVKHDKKFQLIKSFMLHRLVNKEKCVITSDSIIYPYSKGFNTLKFNYWQANMGQIQLIRHVAYDMESGGLISKRNEVVKNDGSNFVSAVEFERESEGPVRVICEIKTTNTFKSLFDEGSDEIESYHRLRVEHYSFSLFLPNYDDYSNVKVYANGKQCAFSRVPGGRMMKHEIFKTNSPMTIYSFVYKKQK